MQSIEDKPNLGVFYAPDSLLWEQWWSLNQPSALFGSSEDRSSMAIGLYRQIGGSGPLPDDFAQGYDTNSTDPWNEPNPVTEGTAPSSTSDHMVSNESPITPDAQVHDQLSTDEKSAQKREHDFGDRPSRKSKRRSSSQDDDLNSKLDIKGEGSNVDPVGNRSSNPTQHSIKGRNRIASNKFRVKKREDVLRLESNEQDMERIHCALSTCVSDLLLEVYELKMQLLRHTECNCAYIQNYLAHEAQRYIHALEEQSQ